MTLTHQGYNLGHPWYYLLGGPIPTVKTIQANVIAGDYAGYLARTISEVDRKAEPQRSTKLDALRAQIVEDLHDDITRYRTCARDLQKRARLTKMARQTRRDHRAGMQRGSYGDLS